MLRQTSLVPYDVSLSFTSSTHSAPASASSVSSPTNTSISSAPANASNAVALAVVTYKQCWRCSVHVRYPHAFAFGVAPRVRTGANSSQSPPPPPVDCCILFYFPCSYAWKVPASRKPARSPAFPKLCSSAARCRLSYLGGGRDAFQRGGAARQRARAHSRLSTLSCLRGRGRWA